MIAKDCTELILRHELHGHEWLLATELSVSDSLQYFKLHVELQKHVTQYSFTTTFPGYKMSDNIQQTQCHDNRPLYVILSGDTETQLLLSQVTHFSFVAA